MRLRGRLEARLGPAPVRIVLDGDLREARLPDLALDGDEVADDLGRAHFPGGVGRRAAVRATASRRCGNAANASSLA